MVYLLTCLLFLSSFAHATQLDTFFGSAEPAYVQAVAPRFSKWVIENFDISKSPNQKKWHAEILRDSAQIGSWSYKLNSDFSWPRLQFGMRFTKGTHADSYIFILPQNAPQSLLRIQKFFSVPASLQKNWLGYGISLQKNEVYIFNKQENGIRQTLFSDGKWQPSTYLKNMAEPKPSPVPFASLVISWKSWSDEAGKFLQYELTMGAFNLRVLDGAAIATARKVNSEFLLNNLRLFYRSMEDYDVLYP